MNPVFRASEMDRILSCNGSISLTPLVAPRDGDEGWEGTLVHYLVTQRCITELGAIPPEGGLPPPQVPAGYKLPAFSEWIVDWAMRHIRETVPADWSIMVELPLAYEYQWKETKTITVVELVGGVAVLREQEVDGWISSGHIDIVAISPDATEAIGIDWKTGRDPVDPAENNEQVATYTCLLKRAWESLVKVTFQIAQPRADEDSGFERVSTVVVTNLDALVASLDSRVGAAIDNAMELNTGLKQCRWCPAKLQCKAKIKEREFMKDTLTPEDLARVKREPDDALLGDWVVAMRSLAPAGEDAKTLLHARLDKETEIISGGGVRISRKIQGGSYFVPDPVKFMQAVRLLLPKDESIALAYNPSMTRIKDQIAKEMDVPKTSNNGSSAEAIFDGHLAPLVSQGEKRVLIFT